METEKDEKLINSKELARILGLEERTVQLLAKQGVITYQKMGNKNRYDLYRVIQEYVSHCAKKASKKISSLPEGVDWTAYMKATDNIDGDLDMSTANVDFSEIDFNTVAKYDGKLVYTIKDASDNEGRATLNVIIYNGENTTAPTLVIKDEYGTIDIDKNTAEINWKDDFVEEAKDADGLDIKDRRL